MNAVSLRKENKFNLSDRHQIQHKKICPNQEIWFKIIALIEGWVVFYKLSSEENQHRRTFNLSVWDIKNMFLKNLKMAAILEKVQRKFWRKITPIFTLKTITRIKKKGRSSEKEFHINQENLHLIWVKAMRDRQESNLFHKLQMNSIGWVCKNFSLNMSSQNKRFSLPAKK